MGIYGYCKITGGFAEFGQALRQASGLLTDAGRRAALANRIPAPERLLWQTRRGRSQSAGAAFDVKAPNQAWVTDISVPQQAA